MVLLLYNKGTQMTDFIDLSKIKYKTSNKIDWKNMIGKELIYVFRNKTKKVLILDYFKKGNVFYITFQDLNNKNVYERSSSAFKHCVDLYNDLILYKEIDWQKIAENKISLPFSINGICGQLKILQNLPNSVIVDYCGRNFNIPKNDILNLRFLKKFHWRKILNILLGKL